VITRQFASVMPQAISVWSRRRGHATFYASYWGWGDPRRLLPRDLDVVFVASFTQASPIAYALGRLYRREGTRTVIGGPHARAFPADCLRFFDLVVGDCDEELVDGILAGRFDPGSVVASARPLRDVPPVEERMPEIRASAFPFGRRWRLSTVPMLTSLGCPYRCDFCTDWDSPYRQLDPDRVTADMRFVARTLPGTPVMIHDPNFAVGFERTLGALEALPPAERPPYIMESSLTVLRPDRLPRLRATNCLFVAPGIESWTDYSAKAAVGRTAGRAKVERVAEHFRLLSEQVPYLQANFMFGLDGDRGDEPVALTTEFMDRTPFVWPAFNIPVPFGGTPLHEAMLRDGRVLRAMPFGFYYAPFLVMRPRHYDPVGYYERLIRLYSHAASPAMLRRRLASARSRLIRFVHRVRTAGLRSQVASLRRLHAMLRDDAGMRAFHEGRAAPLPERYHALYERMLGPFAGLLSRADRIPDLERVEPVRV
jgi:radical SAM superfamily enzyme YgiQ (UPF0313 family)